MGVLPRHNAIWPWCIAFWLLLVPNAQGQLVSTIDLTLPRPSAPSSADLGHYAEDYKVACSGTGEADGVTIGKGDDHLILAITNAESETLDGQPRIKFTVRLKNLNVFASAEIPREMAPVIPVQTNPKDPTVSYVVATIWVMMGGPKLDQGLITLRGEANFWAQPDNPAHHLKLRPGEWVDFQFESTVVCDEHTAKLCSSYSNGDVVRLTASWYERERTHVRKGCVVTDGAYTSREFSSSPYEFTNNTSIKTDRSTSGPAGLRKMW
jgi:hypothetical protein